jgi:hypothetical protein
MRAVSFRRSSAISIRSSPGRWPTALDLIPCSGRRMDGLFSAPIEVVCGNTLNSDSYQVADPFHVRSVKRSCATTRAAAAAICKHQGWSEWPDPEFQRAILARMSERTRGSPRIRFPSRWIRTARPCKKWNPLMTMSTPGLCVGYDKSFSANAGIVLNIHAAPDRYRNSLRSGSSWHG